MQPIASLTYAKLGLGNEAVKPLAFIAKRVCGPYQRGSFPETANEQRFAYFSPSAALFSEGVIAGIFGVDINRLRGTFTLSPCFPEDWERAELRISHCQITYHKGTYRLQTEPGLRKIFRQKLAPFQKVRAYVNGKEATPAVKVWGNKFEVEIDLGWDPDIQLKLEITPLDFSVSYQNHGTYGEQIQVKVQGAQVVGVDDRCGLLKSFDLTEDGLLVTIGDRLLEPYEKFGWQGLINFARRTFFLKLRHEDRVFCYPCTITVVPPYVVEAKLEGNYLRVNVGEEAVLRLSGEEVPGKGVFVLTDSQLRALSTHQNKGTLYFPRREISLDFVFEAEVQTKIETIPAA